MQFLAFLQDSYREARSGWVLQAMLILALLLVLFVASIAFTPTTVNNVLTSQFQFINWSLKQNPALKGAELLIEDYKASNEREPWKSDYDFQVVIKTPTAEIMKQLDANRDLPFSRARVERMMNSSLPYLKNLKVTKGTETPSERRFLVSSQGTKAEDVTAWPHVPSVLFFFDAPFFSTTLRGGVYILENYLISGAGAWVILFISIVITAGFVPNLLQKGALDLAISKPITRPMLLIYKYVGGLTFTALLTAFAVGGSYLAIGYRTGMWNHNFLLAIPILIFYFAILYAVSVLAAVMTRSTIVSILITIVVWGLFWCSGKVNHGIENRLRNEAKQASGQPQKPLVFPDPNNPDAEKIELDNVLVKLDPEAPLWGFIPKFLFPVFKAVHFVTPRTYQIDDRLGELIARGVLTEAELDQAGYKETPGAQWPELLSVSGGFIVLILGIACWRFSTRDG